MADELKQIIENIRAFQNIGCMSEEFMENMRRFRGELDVIVAEMESGGAATDDPATDLDRLRRLEYGDTRSAYPEAQWGCCPVCGAVDPEERVSEFEHGSPLGISAMRGLGYMERVTALAEKSKDAMERPSGPRHEPDCWLGKRLAE